MERFVAATRSLASSDPRLIPGRVECCQLSSVGKTSHAFFGALQMTLKLFCDGVQRCTEDTVLDFLDPELRDNIFVAD